MNTVKIPANRIDIGQRQDGSVGFQVCAIFDGGVKAYDVVTVASDALTVATEYQSMFPALPIWINPAVSSEVEL
jgi:hypothetical protein